MTPTVEQAIEIIQQLPPPDRERFFDWFFPWIEERRKEKGKKEANKQESTK
jgi:hypothetical protein